MPSTAMEAFLCETIRSGPLADAFPRQMDDFARNEMDFDFSVEKEFSGRDPRVCLAYSLAIITCIARTHQ